MENRYSQLTLEVPSSLLDQVSQMCICPTLKSNPNELILECVKFAARNANTLSANEWNGHNDCYEDFLSTLDFEGI